MKVFLDAVLAGHRRGRFLASLLDAQPLADAEPSAGLLLMTAKDFQAGSDAFVERWTHWVQRPGRTLLLIPPFSEGPIVATLDWRVSYRSEKPMQGKVVSDDDSGERLADLLSGEIVFALEGRDGAADENAGHRWNDGSAHTRYHKAHTGTGLFAATCLPLWSITLMDAAEIVLAWLDALQAHTRPADEAMRVLGDPISSGSTDVPAGQPGRLSALDPESVSLLVCLFGYETGDLQHVRACLGAGPFPIVNLPTDRLPSLLDRLRAARLVDQNGLTEYGLSELQASVFWGFAQRLREELS